MLRRTRRRSPSNVFVLLCAAALIATSAEAQTSQEFQPKIGQPGKDVVWVPTPEDLVEKMLDLAMITPQDFVIDLGSGDGRNVIAAARRGARALGVEYNKDLVELSRRAAASAGVADRATFAQGDMFAANISKASVLALFLLPSNMVRLRAKFLNLKPGSRIVSNTFGMEGWEPDMTDEIVGECESWCRALLWYVPANAAGTWRLPDGELTLKQQYQVIAGTLQTRNELVPVQGRLRGEEIRFAAGGTAYTGQVRGATMEGTFESNGARNAWRATRIRR